MCVCVCVCVCVLTAQVSKFACTPCDLRMFSTADVSKRIAVRESEVQAIERISYATQLGKSPHPSSLLLNKLYGGCLPIQP